MKRTRPKGMPRWTECQWRRVPCGRSSCKLCGRINRARKLHLMKGEDPDSMESAMSDVAASLQETVEMLKNHADEMGIDLNSLDNTAEKEKPDFFKHALHRKLMSWRRQASSLVRKAELGKQPWLSTDPGQDLVWYMSMVQVKTQRLLSGLWDIEQGDEYMDLEVDYTSYVLEECVSILKEALKKLHKMDSPHKLDFMFLYDEFEPLGKEIKSLTSRPNRKSKPKNNQ